MPGITYGQMTAEAPNTATVLRRSVETRSPDPQAKEEVRLGSGVIRGVIGEGGMSVVYEIWNENLGLRRAVKVLRANSSREHKNRFYTEIKLSAQLDHPNVVRIHSVGLWCGMPYIEMELVDGCSLARLLKDSGALPLNVALSIALIVSRALCYTHTLEYSVFGKTGIGILHRDLKPENILISKRGTVKLTDFGIATPVRVSMHTPNGSVVGSLQYISPEQLNEGEVDQKADIYSFGCVLYELLTGLKVFPQKNIALLAKARLSNDFDKLKTFKTEAPARLIGLANKCLELAPERRPADMAEVAAELGRIHKSLYSDSPERIVENFVRNEKKTVTVLAIRNSASILKPMIISASVVLGSMILAAAAFASFKMMAGHQRLQAASMGAVVRSDAAPLNTGVPRLAAEGSVKPGLGETGPETRQGRERQRPHSHAKPTVR